MENLFEKIRYMTADSRMISINTDEPQYLVSQLKTQLFLRESEQPDEVCEWWLRLYRGSETVEDIKKLNKMLKDLQVVCNNEPF